MNYLNLDIEKTKLTVHELNTLLSDYHVYYQKLRNFHWNVSGENFFDLHIKFEELYDDAKLKIDEIAERILTLRFAPVSNLTDYLEQSSLKESASDLSDRAMVDTILKDHGKILKQLTAVVKKADEASDEGTIDLVGAYITRIRKNKLDAGRLEKENFWNLR